MMMARAVIRQGPRRCALRLRAKSRELMRMWTYNLREVIADTGVSHLGSHNRMTTKRESAKHKGSVVAYTPCWGP